MRRTTIQAPTLAIVFWMTLASTLVMTSGPCCSSAIAGAAVARDLGRDRLQRAPDLRLRPGDLDDHGAQPAADRLEHVGDDDPGARRRLRRVVAERELHWQDGAAIVLVLLAIATVLLPARRGTQPVEPA
jgi:hypothetical protein